MNNALGFAVTRSDGNDVLKLGIVIASCIVSMNDGKERKHCLKQPVVFTSARNNLSGKHGGGEMS